MKVLLLIWSRFPFRFSQTFSMLWNFIFWFHYFKKKTFEIIFTVKKYNITNLIIYFALQNIKFNPDSRLCTYSIFVNTSFKNVFFTLSLTPPPPPPPHFIEKIFLLRLVFNSVDYTDPIYWTINSRMADHEVCTFLHNKHSSRA